MIGLGQRHGDPVCPLDPRPREDQHGANDMSREFEILGRPPVMRSRPVADTPPPEDWRGEDKIRVTKVPHGGGRYPVAPSGAMKLAKMRARRSRVSQLFREGHSKTIIARNIGVSEQTIYSDLRSMGLVR